MLCQRHRHWSMMTSGSNQELHRGDCAARAAAAKAGRGVWLCVGIITSSSD